MANKKAGLPRSDVMANKKAVYAVMEREGGRSVWIRVGSAWQNRDGSITVQMDAFTLSGTLEIRDIEPPSPAPKKDG